MSPQLLKRLDRFADILVAPSFSRMSMAWRPKLWDPSDLSVSLEGKTAVITGANSGIGKATALEVARRGGHVVVVARDERRGNGAVEELRRQTSNELVSFELADLSLLRNVRSLAARLQERFDAIDFLVNNAGTYGVKREVTAEGIERVFATNVLAPFLLTKLLLPQITKRRGGRVVFVSSGGMYMSPLNVDDPQFENRKFTDLASYAESKRALVVLNELFAQKFADRGVSFYAMHPGWVHTPILQSGMPVFTKLFRSILREPSEGADTVVWLLACPRIGEQTGLFWFDRKPRAIHMSKKTRTSGDNAVRFWNLCEQLTSQPE